jgi:hypothetical protein
MTDRMGGWGPLLGLQGTLYLVGRDLVGGGELKAVTSKRIVGTWEFPLHCHPREALGLGSVLTEMHKGMGISVQLYFASPVVDRRPTE